MTKVIEVKPSLSVKQVLIGIFMAIFVVAFACLLIGAGEVKASEATAGDPVVTELRDPGWWEGVDNIACHKVPVLEGKWVCYSVELAEDDEVGEDVKVQSEPSETLVDAAMQLIK